MALFSPFVDNIYRSLLVVERDSRYYSEIMDPLRPFHVVHVEKKRRRTTEGILTEGLIRSKVGKTNFPVEPCVTDLTISVCC